MTSRDFVIWLRGFTEACNDFTATPQQWDRIKEVLDSVEDYNDNPGLDEEVEDWNDWYHNPNTFREPQNPPYRPYNPYAPPYWTGDPPGWMQFPGTTSGTITIPSSSGISFTSSSGTTANTNVVWNDQMGCWHYTNYPHGFGYFTNSTVEAKNKKEQLND